jgi:beta-xylosidase
MGYFNRAGGFIIFSLLNVLFVHGQSKETDSSLFYQTVKTYVNPVLPGDHPDPTLLKVGDDFYHCGSTFHFNPYLPIYHSKDLVHWEVISRVLPSSIEVVASSKGKGKLEIWLDDLQHGKLIATIPVTMTGSDHWKSFSKSLKDVTGQHDVFVKFPSGPPHHIYIKSIKFPDR